MRAVWLVLPHLGSGSDGPYYGAIVAISPDGTDSSPIWVSPYPFPTKEEAVEQAGKQAKRDGIKIIA